MKTTILVSDPRREAQAQQTELLDAFGRFLGSGRYVHGPEHAAFEAEFADYLGVAHCLGVASGTDALELALSGVGCSPGDEVLVAANCGGYASTAARRVGLRVTFADVDPTTLSLSAESVGAALSSETRAVVVTHLYGLVGDVAGIVERCRELEIAVIEDCAQAAGARSAGRHAGSFADVSTFSFYPTKNLAALGDGGAVVTQDDAVAARVRALRQYGWETKYRVVTPGGQNSRLDELQAAVLRIRLRELDERNARRRAIVSRYAESLAPEAGRFVASPNEDYVAHLAVAVLEERTRARAAFEAAAIGTDVHYPVADHRQPAWADEYRHVSLPVTEHAVDHVLTVPCFPELSDEETELVCQVLREL